MIRRVLAAVAALIAATIVSLINSEPGTTAPAPVPATSISIPGTQARLEGDAGWSCREVTEHGNGVCGSDLPEGFTVADIAECVTPALYAGCPAAVRERLNR
jgi:hypothetical protein